MDILSDDQLHDYCLEVAKCPAFLDELKPYAKQALRNYAKEQQTRKFFSDGERAYYRAMMPVYEAADVVLALIDAPTPALAPSEGQKAPVSDAPAKRGRTGEVAELKVVKLEQVQKVFLDLNIGAGSTPGERAAAVTALSVNNYLEGNPYALKPVDSGEVTFGDAPSRIKRQRMVSH